MSSPVPSVGSATNITIGPGSIDGRWHFMPVELSFATSADGAVSASSAESPAVGRGTDRVSAYRDWMRSAVRRYLELAKLATDQRSPELAREWKWLSKILRRS